MTTDTQPTLASTIAALLTGTYDVPTSKATMAADLAIQAATNADRAVDDVLNLITDDPIVTAATALAVTQLQIARAHKRRGDLEALLELAVMLFHTLPATGATGADTPASTPKA